MKPLPFGFPFLSGPGRPRETPTLRFYAFLSRIAPKHSNHSGNTAPLPATRVLSRLLASFLPPSATCWPHRCTAAHLRLALRTVVTSRANLWLLHCHIKNENQCLWLRACCSVEQWNDSGEKAALASTLRKSTSSRQLQGRCCAGWSCSPHHQHIKRDRRDRSAREPGTFLRFDFIPSLPLVQSEPVWPWPRPQYLLPPHPRQTQTYYHTVVRAIKVTLLCVKMAANISPEVIQVQYLWGGN